jgi:hypothetical protein
MHGSKSQRHSDVIDTAEADSGVNDTYVPRDQEFERLWLLLKRISIKKIA